MTRWHRDRTLKTLYEGVRVSLGEAVRAQVIAEYKLRHVTDLHSPTDDGAWCEHCSHFLEAGPWIDSHHIEDDARWPCPTVRALTGLEP